MGCDNPGKKINLKIMGTSTNQKPLSSNGVVSNIVNEKFTGLSSKGNPLSKPLNKPILGVHDPVVDSLNAGSSLKTNESILSHDITYELIMQGDGNLVLYRISDRHPLWSTGTKNSGAVQAVMQVSGNLVLYTAGRIPGQRDRAKVILDTFALNSSNKTKTGTQQQVFQQSGLQQTSRNVQQVLSQASLQEEISSQNTELLATQVWASGKGGFPLSYLRLQNDGNLVIFNKDHNKVWDVQGQKYNTAKINIQKTYEQIGANKSALGLPVTDVIPDGENFVQHFRSGMITTNGLFPDIPKAIQTNRVQVFFTGIECRIRQEAQDEIFGTVASFTPSSGANLIHHFPEGQEYWTLGEDAPRIVQSNAMICDSVAGDIYIVCSLVEHDSGNIDEYKKKVAELISTAAKSFAAVEGVPAEALASDQGLIGDISLGLVNVISGAIGADDDPYNSGSIRIDKAQILNKFKTDFSAPDQFPKFLLQRDDDPRTLSYTHVVYLSGTDQGGDTGTYGLYFEVRLTSMWEIVNPV